MEHRKKLDDPRDEAFALAVLALLEDNPNPPPGVTMSSHAQVCSLLRIWVGGGLIALPTTRSVIIDLMGSAFGYEFPQLKEVHALLYGEAPDV